MKKLFAVVLSLLIAVNCVSFAEQQNYSPSLGMKMSDFIQKYNAVGSSLNSSLLALNFPVSWFEHEGYNVTFFKADKKAGVTIFLLSSEPDKANNLSTGLDQVQIYCEAAEDLPALITITEKCSSVFADNILGTSLSSFVVTYVISYYYENLKETPGYVAYRALESEDKYRLQFWIDESGYYFSIVPGDAQ